MIAEEHDYNTEEFIFLNHEDLSLMLRLYRPCGDGPFPVIIDLHGGAWTTGDLSGCRARDEVLAKHGFAAAAIDFRHAENGYPTSLIDINFAIRWMKHKAKDLCLDPNRVALSGQSSGGHLAMLAAMRPEDSRYCSIPLDDPAKADVCCVAMTWPVINPLSRYRHALQLRSGTEPPPWTGNIPERHDLYWKTEENMAEGNPMLALERGEQISTPPAIWIQGRPDQIHDYRDPESELEMNEPERFAAHYRKVGGEFELKYVPQGCRDEASYKPIISFFKNYLK